MAEGLVDHKLVKALNFIAGRRKAALMFWFLSYLVILDVVCRYLPLFLLYINIKR